MQRLFHKYTLPLTFMLMGHSCALYIAKSGTVTPNLIHIAELSEEELLHTLNQRTLSREQALNFLHAAARRGYLSVVKLLLAHAYIQSQVQHAADSQYIALSTDQDALYFAVAHGYTKIVQALIESGIHIDMQDDCDCTPLFYAAGHGHVEIVKFLIEKGANTTLTDDRNNTVLHAASYAGHDDVVSFLLAQKIDPNPRNLANETPLHQAARKGYSKTVEVLLRQGKADVEARVVDYRTALHHAATIGNSDIIECLLDHHAPPLVIDSSGKTPLDYALDHKSVAAACLLIQRYTSSNLKRHGNFFIFGDDKFTTRILWGLLEYLVNDANREIRDFFHDLSLTKIKKITKKTGNWLRTSLGRIWHIIHMYTSPYCDTHRNPFTDAQQNVTKLFEDIMPKDLVVELFTFLPAPWFIQKKRSREKLGQGATKAGPTKRHCSA